MCDRIGIFAAGRLIGQGTMQELADRFGDGRREIEVGLELPEDADDASARATLAAVPGVASVADGSRPGDPWTLTVAPGHDPVEVRTGVLAAVAAAGLPLASIRLVLPSLEDIYRKAVARPPASVARPATSADAVAAAARRAAGAGVATAPKAPATDLGDPPVVVVTDPEPRRGVELDPVEPLVLPADPPSTEDDR